MTLDDTELPSEGAAPPRPPLLARGIMAVTERLPFAVASGMGAALGALFYHLNQDRRARTLRNISRVLPELAEREREALAVESFRTIGRTMLESFLIPRLAPEWFDEHISAAHPERLERFLAMVRERGRGGVCLATHLGNWEMGLQFWQRLIPQKGILAVASRPKKAWAEGPVRRYREAHGARIVWRGEAALPLMRHLRGGGLVAMVIDHNIVGEGVSVPFFGRPAHTLLAPGRLLLRSGAPALVVCFYRAGRDRFVMDCDEPFVPPEPAPDKEGRLRQEADLTAEYTARVEALVRRHPEQWMWMHRRWKKRSPEESPYWPAPESG